MRLTTSFLTHHSASDALNESPADAMARKACEKAARKQNAMAFVGNDDLVITAVSSALSRAFSDPKFNTLPEAQKTEAASRLAEQFMQGQRLVQALTSALNNPSTLATQLKYNLREDEDVNVFETIIDSTRPVEPILPNDVQPSLAFVGRMQ